VTHRFVDTHCHFDFPPFMGDEAQSIAKAAEAGVQAIIVPSVEAAYFSRVLDLSMRHPALYAALGLHPIVIERHLDEHIERLDEVLQTAGDKLVAIGEIGSIFIARIRSLSASRRSSTRSSGRRSATICRSSSIQDVRTISWRCT